MTLKLTFILVGIAVAGVSFADTLIYNPNLATLPQAQGWTYFDNGFSPQPSVSGGILTHDSGAAGARWWERHTVNPIDFNAGASITADVRVISSDYQPTGLQRAGYYLAMADSAGRLAYVGITSTGVFLLNDLTTIQSFVTMDTTSAFHTYSVKASANTISLLVDNASVSSVGLGTANGGSYDNYVWFGAGTTSMRSDTRTKTVTFTSVPEPATFAILGLGLLGFRLRKRQ